MFKMVQRLDWPKCKEEVGNAGDIWRSMQDIGVSGGTVVRLKHPRE